MGKSRFSLFVSSLFLLAILLIACGGEETATPAPPTEAAEEPIAAQPTAEEEVATEPPPTEPPPTDAPPATESPLDQMEHVADPLLVDKVWEWVRRDDSSGNTIITVPDPTAYTIQYNENGDFGATIDCNNAGGRYATPTPGNIFMELQTMTAAECGPASLSEQMINMFGPAQSYRFEEDGQVLVFIWAAGGPLDYYRDASAEAPGEAELEAIPPDSIQLDLQGLADSYAWSVEPGFPPSPGPGGGGMPPHILLTFDGATPEEVMENRGPRMYIFPTQAYVSMYNTLGNSIVADQVILLEELIASAGARQGLPESPMPLLPPPNSFMDRWVQFLDLNFGVGEGVRYVSDSPNRQQLGPWTNETTDYFYQGLTSDKVFYVSLFWPESTDSLPDTIEDVTAEVMEAASNPDTSLAYQQEVKDTLNALPSTAWDPDLSRLDAMMATLTFPTGSESEAESETEPGDAEEVELPAPDEGEPTGTVTAADGVFIRSGPGFEYTILGAAPFEATVEIIGRSEDGLWLVINIPSAPNEEGWVAAEFVEVENANNLPVVPAPPLESFPTTTPVLTATAVITGTPGPEATLTPEGTATPEGTPASAQGIQFFLASFGAGGVQLPLIPGTSISATFGDTEVTGFSGCNNYTGALTPVDDYFTVGPIISTQQVCADPLGVMEQEQAFLAALEATDGFRWVTGEVNGSEVITAGQVFYTLIDGADGVLNFVAP